MTSSGSFLFWAQPACSMAPPLTVPQLEACSQGDRDTPAFLSQLTRSPELLCALPWFHVEDEAEITPIL